MYSFDSRGDAEAQTDTKNSSHVEYMRSAKSSNSEHWKWGFCQNPVYSIKTCVLPWIHVHRSESTYQGTWETRRVQTESGFQSCTLQRGRRKEDANRASYENGEWRQRAKGLRLAKKRSRLTTNWTHTGTRSLNWWSSIYSFEKII